MSSPRELSFYPNEENFTNVHSIQPNHESFSTIYSSPNTNILHMELSYQNIHQSSSDGFQKILQNYKIIELICFYVGIEYYPNLLLNRTMVRYVLYYHDFGRKSLLQAFNYLHFNVNCYEDEDENLQLKFIPNMLLILIRRMVSWPQSSMNDGRMEQVVDRNDNSLNMIDWTHIIPIEKYIYLGNYHFPCLMSNNLFTWPDGSISTSFAPFTRYFKERQSNTINISLSCVAYFELCYKPDESNSEDYNSSSNHVDFAIGLATSTTPLRLEEVLSVGAWNAVAYHCDGRCFQSGMVIKGIEGPKYDVGDIIGCGIVYPPLGHSYGQVFFTKNGDIALTLDLGFNGFYSLPWFPVIYISSLHINADFNFGINEPFIYDVMDYEKMLIRKSKNVENMQMYYKQIILEQEKIVKPTLHPALRDRDPSALKDHFSTVATMSDCSDPTDGNKSITTTHDINSSNNNNHHHHHHSNYNRSSNRSGSNNNNNNSNSNDKNYHHHHHRNGSSSNGSNSNSTNKRRKRDDQAQSLDALCSVSNTNEMEPDWNEDDNNVLDNMSSASQHRERSEMISTTEVLPHKRRLFALVGLFDKKPMGRYSQVSPDMGSNLNLNLNSNSSSILHDNGYSGLNELVRTASSAFETSPKRQYRNDNQKLSLRFHDSLHSSTSVSTSAISSSSAAYLPYWKTTETAMSQQYDERFSTMETNTMSDNVSVATSLLVEVASIDEDGLYVSYGGQSDDDDLSGNEGDSPRMGGSSPDLSTGIHVSYFNSPVLLPTSIGPAPTFSFSIDETLPPIRSSSSSVSSYSIRDEVQNPAPGSADDWSLYGYDGGSERCRRDDESDYEGDDLGTVGDMDGDIDGNTSTSFKDKSVLADDESTYILNTTSRRRRFSIPSSSNTGVSAISGINSVSISNRVGVRYPSENCYPSLGSHHNNGSSPITMSTTITSATATGVNTTGTSATPVILLSSASVSSIATTTVDKLPTSLSNPQLYGSQVHWSPGKSKYHQHQYYQSRKREKRKSLNS